MSSESTYFYQISRGFQSYHCLCYILYSQGPEDMTTNTADSAKCQSFSHNYNAQPSFEPCKKETLQWNISYYKNFGDCFSNEGLRCFAKSVHHCLCHLHSFF